MTLGLLFVSLYDCEGVVNIRIISGAREKPVHNHNRNIVEIPVL